MKDTINFVFALSLIFTILWIIVNILYPIPSYLGVSIGFLLGSLNVVFGKAYYEGKIF